MINGLRPPPPPKPNPPPPPNPPAIWDRSQTMGDGVVVPKPIVYTRRRRAAACCAAVFGSTPCVLAPSVSNDDGGGRVAGLPLPRRPSRRSGATDGSISAIASIEVRIAWPMAVPRDVCRFFIATSSLSRVGGRRDQFGGRPGERHQSDSRPVHLRLDEIGRGLLRRVQPVRRDVGRAHRTGDVQGQHDRRRVGRHGHRLSSGGPHRGRARPGRARAARPGCGGATGSGPAARRAPAPPTSPARPRGAVGAVTTRRSRARSGSPPVSAVPTAS